MNSETIERIQLPDYAAPSFVDRTKYLHVIGTGSALRGAVICFYLSNEGLSLLENAAHLGLPVPDRLKDVLSQLHNRDGKSDEMNDGEGKNQ